MIAVSIAVFSALWMKVTQAEAYTIHSAFVFANTGDRTPLLYTSIEPTLTNLGAQQLYNLGNFFRQRYIGVSLDGNANTLQGLASNKVDNDQLFITTVDSQYTIASAQAFMQGFYPPYDLGASDSTNALDMSAMLANNTYVSAPLNGYQYAVIDSVGQYDPYIIYLTGTQGCTNFQIYAEAFYSSAVFNETELATATIYKTLGSAVLEGVLPEDEWSYSNAYLIWDYISYQYLHNSTAYDILTASEYNSSEQQLHWLASKKQWEIYADTTVSDGGYADSILTIGGQTLAARIAGLLSDNVGSSGDSAIFNLAVGEYDVMLSLFSSLSVENIDSNFKVLPPYGSALVFELFSYDNNTNEGYPDISELWVRFLYVNGSLTGENPNPSIQSYPIFGNGPDQTEIPWETFYESMLNIGLADVGDWCTLCNSDAVFCPWFVDGSSTSPGSSDTKTDTKKSGLSPAVAGVIGAVVTIAVGAIFLGLAMFFGGVRFYRNNKSKKHDLGGFKGSAKLASDADLHIPKNAAPIGIVAEEVGDEQKKGHERVGSWEMKGDQNEGRNTFSSLGGATVKADDYGDGAKMSFEDHDGINPFSTPVQARESV